jgi:peptidoglycan/xylan/chitin deacetylase (PgdA/CDA1 family)
LQNNDFSVLPLHVMLKKLKQKTLPNKCVVLTADDAYTSIAKNAYPLLKKYHMSLSVFVATNAVDKKYRAIMNWDKMRDIQGENITFYNHTHTHVHLLDLNQSQIKLEISTAQNRLKNELGVIDKIFAYPYGEASIETIKQLEKDNYIAFGQHSGVVSNDSDLQNLSRFPMAANFAKMSSFKVKVNTLPMPIIARRVSTLIEKNPPTLRLKFKQPLKKFQQQQFNCFASGGVNIDWKNNQNVSVTAKNPLTGRRSKYNCTMPSKHKGRYYWVSTQWVDSKISE